MNYWLIGKLYHNDKHIGYTITDQDGNILNVDFKTTYALLGKGKLVNALFQKVNGVGHLTIRDTPYNETPIFSVKSATLVTPNCIVVYAIILPSDPVITYKVVKTDGQIEVYTSQELEQLIDNGNYVLHLGNIPKVK